LAFLVSPDLKCEIQGTEDDEARSRRPGLKTYARRERLGGPKPGRKPRRRTCKTKPDRREIPPQD